MKKTVAIFIMIAFLSCERQNSQILSENVVVFETNNISKFKDSTKSEIGFAEFSEIDEILKIAVDNYNKDVVDYYNKTGKKYDGERALIDLKKYKRQYVPYISNDGKNKVWVNLFCDAKNINWKEDIVYVKDGGKCYFNLKIDIENKKVENLFINGES